MIVMDANVRSDYPTIGSLVTFGMSLPPFSQRTLNPGEAKTKLAFLSFSSGTTGLPKERGQHFHPELDILMAAIITGCLHFSL